MEPSSGKCQENSSGTVSPQLTENDDELSNNLSVNLGQTLDSGPVNDEDIIKTTLFSINELQSNSKVGSSTATSYELQEMSLEYEEEISIEGVTKTEEEEPKEVFFKTIDDSVVVIAYPTKHKPKQPFVVQPPDQSGSNNSPRPPFVPRLPPSSAQPPVIPQQNSNHRIHHSGPDSAVTQQPHDPQRGTQRPATLGVPIFVDPFSLNPGIPAYIMPAALYSRVVWAPIPAKIPRDVPNSLAHLLVTESFYITQISWFGYFSDMEEYFLIQNKHGECLYFVYETMDYGEYALCESYRAYRLHVVDMYQNEAIFMHKLSGCTSCCCCYPGIVHKFSKILTISRFVEDDLRSQQPRQNMFFYTSRISHRAMSKEMLVCAPPGAPVGAITKKYNFTREEYSLLDPDRNKMFKMLGPFCATCCCWTLEADFTIHALDSNETEVGFIRREAGFFRSSTGSILLGLTLPIDMDVRIKALFLGAVFLVVR